MQNNDLYFEIGDLKNKVEDLKNVIDEIKAVVKPEEEMWDNADMIQNWKISVRTLASWREKGIIGFVQYGNKIWYPREARELFMKSHFNQTNREVNDNG